MNITQLLFLTPIATGNVFYQLLEKEAGTKKATIAICVAMPLCHQQPESLTKETNPQKNKKHRSH